MASHEIDPKKPPSGTGCAECSAAGGWWLHLRRCAACGHVGCCDSSPSRHARAHYEQSGHRVMASFEPGEEWFFDWETNDFVDGPDLAAPRWHPENQGVPAPRDRVPRDWQSKLH